MSRLFKKNFLYSKLFNQVKGKNLIPKFNWKTKSLIKLVSKFILPKEKNRILKLIF